VSLLLTRQREDPDQQHLDVLRQRGAKRETYRLPRQPKVHPRELGPRLLEGVLPGDVAAVMAATAREVGWTDEERLFTLDGHDLPEPVNNVGLAGAERRNGTSELLVGIELDFYPCQVGCRFDRGLWPLGRE
jgi:hypothetical protein